MNQERWTQIQDLFADAMDRPEAERSAFLRRACGGDPALYDEVASLVGVELHSLFAGYAVDAVPLDDVLSSHGDRIGPWRLERRLGAGGMGAVYFARRSDGGFEQTAALKLVKRGMDSEAVVARFRAERRILARLTHPGIARLLDGGVADDGRPYFAMDYVEGTPITAACDARALDVTARLALFEDACRAVAYAHRNLVVHRDLKPSNILVTGAGEVKLLDFGIAKLLSGDEADDGLTRTGMRVLTPAYAAPEQRTGGVVTTATDVYGLGIVLYELLSGQRPVADAAGMPVRPSRVDVPEETARARAASPERLRRTLRGDLDTIVLKALHPDPARRYASAEELRADVAAFRTARPIAARPDAAGYRLRKYVQRHRARVAVALLALLVVGATAAFSFVRVRAERDRAQAALARSEAVTAFLSDLFTAADPARLGADATARELLARGAERVDDGLATDPETRAEMLHVIGDAHKRIELFDEAQALLERALALRVQVHGEAHTDVARTLDALVLLYERQGRYTDAVEAGERALAIHRQHTAEPLVLADGLHNLAFVLMRVRRLDEAEALIREGIGIKRRLLGPDDPSVAYSLNILGDVLNKQLRFDESEATHLQALRIRQAALPPDHIDLAYTRHNLAANYRDQKRWPESEASYREALRLWRLHFGDASRVTANTLSSLALAVGMQQRWAEADTLYRLAIDALDGSVGAEHVIRAVADVRHADVLAMQHRWAEAEALYRDAIARVRRLLGEDHQFIGRWTMGLGRYVARQGRTEEGLRLVREGSTQCRRVAPQSALCALSRERARTDLEAMGLDAPSELHD